MPILQSIDLIAIVAPQGSAFIRMANFMNSEIVGVKTAVPWAFVFNRVDSIPRHPTQLYEAGAYLIIFIINMAAYKKIKNTIGSGLIFGFTIASIFLSRFTLEFLKENQVDFESNLILDMGQILSIPFIVIGLYFIYRSIKRENSHSKL